MTERHRDGLKYLAQEVKRRHHEHRVAEALEIAAEAVCFDLSVGDEHEHDQRPAQQHRHVRRRRKKAEQRRQAAPERQPEDRRNERHHVHPFFTHVAAHEALRRQHDLFGDRLPLGDIFDLEVMRQPDAKPRQHQHHAPRHDKARRDGDAAEDGNGKVNRRTVNIYIHSFVASFCALRDVIARRSSITGCGTKNGTSAAM